MKKFVVWFVGILLALLVLIFVVLFTPPGNALLKPIIQGQIDKYAPLKLDVEKFSLGFSSLDVLIAHGDDIYITLGGDFSLFSQTLDLALKIDAKDISALGELAGTPLNGSFVLNTTAKGTLSNLEINTTSDIAKSFTDIRVNLKDFTPTNILASIKDLQVKELLAMAGVKPYASGAFNFEADIKGGLDSQNVLNFDGNALLSIAQGVVDSALIKKDFQIDVPKTTFMLTLNALFNKDKVNHDLSLNTNVGNIHSQGQTLLSDLTTTTSYDVKLSDLGAFTPLVGMPIRGSFNTNGELKGGAEELLIKGISDIASSSTTYEAMLKNLAPFNVKASIKDMRLDTLLWMIYMPRYANMKLNVDSEVSDFDKNFTTQTSLRLNGTTNNAVMKQEMDMDMPNTNFTLTSKVTLKEGVGEVNSQLSSDIASLNLAQTNIDLKNFAFKVPYVATIPDFKKLKFLTGAELAGNFKGDGIAKLENNKLYADFATQSFGGSINAQLNDDKLTAKIANVNTLKFFEIAQLKPVFSSDMNGDLNYDTITQKGTLKAVLSNGKLIPNEITNLAEKYLKTDITKEAYEDTGLNATINKKLISADIGLKSKNTAIYAQGASIDLDKNNINADLKFQIKDKYILLKARNSLKSPSLSIDANDLIKAEASKALSKGAEKAIDKYIKDDKIKDGAQKLLNNLFK